MSPLEFSKKLQLFLNYGYMDENQFTSKNIKIPKQKGVYGAPVTVPAIGFYFVLPESKKWK